MLEFASKNPGAMVGIFGILSSLLAFASVIIIGLIKGWWTNTGKTSDAMWKKLKEVEDRQWDLRIKDLPCFIKRDELKELKDTWSGLATDLKNFMNSCREGNCLAGHLAKEREVAP